jgi:hypothetical protein
MVRSFCFILMTSERKSAISYFMVNELFNYLFLLSTFKPLSISLLLTKIGLPPFHFWVPLVAKGLKKIELFAFLTVFKGPVGILLLKLNPTSFVPILIAGGVFLTIQLISVKDRVPLIILRRVGRRSLPILLRIFLGKNSSLALFFLYLILFLLLIEERGSREIGVGGILVLVLLSFPLIPIFLFKLFLARRGMRVILLLILIFSSIFLRFSYLSLLLILVSEGGRKIRNSLPLIFLFSILLFF